MFNFSLIYYYHTFSCSVLLIAVRGATTAGEKRGEAGELFLPPLGLARATLVVRLDIHEAVRMKGCMKYALLSLGGIKSTSRD